MAKKLLREETPKWLEILQWLADNGALGPTGCRHRQADIAAAVGLNPKNLGYYVKAMEQYGVLSVRRTTVDGSFSSPRGFNIYTLHCTPARWRDELGPAIAAERRARVDAHRTVLNRNNAREQARKRLRDRLEALGPSPNDPPAEVRTSRSAPRAGRIPPAPPPAPEPTFSPDELPTIVERFRDPSADLTGW